MPKNPRVYLDFTIGSKAAGRVVIELFVDMTPKTAENFRGLCTSEYGVGKISQKKLHYLGSKIHRIVEDFVIQGGDIVNFDGSGGESIYGKHFNDENFQRRHAHAGLLSMANHGRNTNSSQYFITLKPCPHLDGKHVVFGQVIEGMDVIRQIGKVPTDMYERPRIPVHVFDCGEVDDRKKLQRENDLINTVAEFQKMREEKMKQKQKEADEKQKRLQEEEKIDKIEEIDQEDEEVQEMEKLKKESTNDKYAQKRLELMMKMNEARKLNNKAVVDETERLTDPQYERRRNKEEFQNNKKDQQKELEDKGLGKDKAYAYDPAALAEKLANKKKRNATFGWDVFNEDTLYKAYHKKTKKLEKQNLDELTEEQRAELLIQDIKEQKEKRAEFSRRRMHVDEKDVDYINERNKVFNEKLNRNYSKYAAEIKANIESGHAL